MKLPTVTQSADMFSAMGSESRLTILRMLLNAAPNGMTVGDIQEKTGIANSTLSHHLDKLRRENLVYSEKDKQWIWYFADLNTMTALLQFLYNDCCGGKGKVNLGSNC